MKTSKFFEKSSEEGFSLSKLIKVLVQQTGEFECLTPSEFFNQYLNPLK